MDEKPLIQQYLQLRSEFMGYLYAVTRDAELAEEVYQNAAVVVMEKAEGPERNEAALTALHSIYIVRLALLEGAALFGAVIVV